MGKAAPVLEVRVGQIWESNYKGPGTNMLLTVLEISETHAVVKGFVRTKIRLDRFRDVANGYRLVRDYPRTTE